MLPTAPPLPARPAATTVPIRPAAADEPPVVIVGAGPVGMRLAQALRRRRPTQPLVIYGDESHPPYNRVRLSSLLAGELGWNAVVDDDLQLGAADGVSLRLGCAVVAIDRAAQTVRDARGALQPYRALVLATGSQPLVPQIPGIGQEGVFTFRDLRDAERLLARRMRSRHTVVLGGGLLGLEAARAMRRFSTRVTVLEHAPRLMARQLDDGGAALLLQAVQAQHIAVRLDNGVKEVLGNGRVDGLLLRSGERLDCDTLVVAAGIAPRVSLALEARLPIGRGIRVDDRMRTEDPNIFAVGECAEHRGRVYGLVAPGLEQAAVAAQVLAGGDAQYNGSHAAARLKVVGTPVFSIGTVTDERGVDTRALHWQAADGSAYRSVVLQGGRLVGASAVGDGADLARLQEAVLARRRVWPWQAWRLRRSGALWPAQDEADIGAWPDAAVVCHCTGVTCGTLRAAQAAGAGSAAALCAATGASSVCGSCRPQLEQLAGGSAAPAAPVRGARWLWGVGLGGTLAAAAMAALPGIDYPDSADLRWRWDALWRDDLLKQISGYALVLMMAALATLSLRKRLPLAQAGAGTWLGRFDGWRVVHAVIGVALLAGLLVHSGGRAGQHLNLLLSISLLGAVVAGGLASAAIAREHTHPAQARRLRRASFWAHVLLLWPMPVLLAFHVLKFYYFGGGA